MKPVACVVNTRTQLMIICSSAVITSRQTEIEKFVLCFTRTIWTSQRFDMTEGENPSQFTQNTRKLTVTILEECVEH